jgi:hypothetical protein
VVFEVELAFEGLVDRLDLRLARSWPAKVLTHRLRAPHHTGGLAPPLGPPEAPVVSFRAWEPYDDALVQALTCAGQWSGVTPVDRY